MADRPPEVTVSETGALTVDAIQLAATREAQRQVEAMREWIVLDEVAEFTPEQWALIRRWKAKA